VEWIAVAIMAAAALVGGRIGVAVAVRINDKVLRWLVVVFGVMAAVRLMLPVY
jgi:uncharacterized membrane protein YfcA